MKCHHKGEIFWIRPNWYSFKPRIPRILCELCGKWMDIEFVEQQKEGVK